MPNRFRKPPKRAHPSSGSPTSALNPMQARFVGEYLIDLNGKQAVIRAGYSKRSAAEQACILLATPKVRAAIDEGKRLQARTSKVSAARTIEEIRRLAYADPRDICDDNWDLKAPSELTDEAAATIASVERIETQKGFRLKVKTWSKEKALELLARHQALLTDVVRVEDSEKQIALLHAGRARVAKARAAREGK